MMGGQSGDEPVFAVADSARFVTQHAQGFGQLIVLLDQIRKSTVSDRA
jgi:hypothetical protein